MYAINSDGTQKWACTVGSAFSGSNSPSIGSNGTIYVGRYDGILYAISPDGNQKWTYNTGNRIFGTPAIGSNGTIYVVSSDEYTVGKLGAITDNRTSGTLKWSYDIGTCNTISSPTIGSDGTIYVGNFD